MKCWRLSVGFQEDGCLREWEKNRAEQRNYPKGQPYPAKAASLLPEHWAGWPLSWSCISNVLPQCGHLTWTCYPHAALSFYSWLFSPKSSSLLLTLPTVPSRTPSLLKRNPSILRLFSKHSYRLKVYLNSSPLKLRPLLQPKTHKLLSKCLLSGRSCLKHSQPHS